MDKEPRNKKLETAGKAADTAVSTVVGAVGLAAKIVVTVLLVILTTTLLLACVFAFYVKTCLTEDIDISLAALERRAPKIGVRSSPNQSQAAFGASGRAD